jgi:hypothetical protein
MKILLAIFLLSLTSILHASDFSHIQSLKVIMGDIGEASNDLNFGIVTEDYKLIMSAANIIHDHGKPKNDLPIIVKALGKDMPKFKANDTVVHDTALEIEKLAGTKNMEAILPLHTKMLNACVSCHSAFRERLVKVLH